MTDITPTEEKNFEAAMQAARAAVAKTLGEALAAGRLHPNDRISVGGEEIGPGFRVGDKFFDLTNQQRKILTDTARRMEAGDRPIDLGFVAGMAARVPTKTKTAVGSREAARERLHAGIRWATDVGAIYRLVVVAKSGVSQAVGRDVARELYETYLLAQKAKKDGLEVRYVAVVTPANMLSCALVVANSNQTDVIEKELRRTSTALIITHRGVQMHAASPGAFVGFLGCTEKLYDNDKL